MLKNEHIQNGMRYMQICEDARSEVESLANDLQGADISKVTSHIKGAKTLDRLRRLQLTLSAT